VLNLAVGPAVQLAVSLHSPEPRIPALAGLDLLN